MEKAMFAAGCFWGVEETFRKLPGVLKTAVGYSGGELDNPNYEAVCAGDTGHAEVVYIEFDINQISYEALLQVFWQCHNPTTLNRQGPDIGSQYRSAIFFYNETQQAIAKSSKAEHQKLLGDKQLIVTEISPVQTFYMAEDYHQQYFQKRGINHC